MQAQCIYIKYVECYSGSSSGSSMLIFHIGQDEITHDWDKKCVFLVLFFSDLPTPKHDSKIFYQSQKKVTSHLQVWFCLFSMH